MTHLVHYYPRALAEQSGPTAAIAAWCQAQLNHGFRVTIAHAPSDTAAERQSYPDGVDLHEVRHLGSSRSSYLPRDMRALLGSADLVLLHEGWVASNYVAAVQARAAGCQYVVMPHGAHEPQILRKLKGLTAARLATERKFLRGAGAVHVFFESETRLTRAIQEPKAMVVAPTGWTTTEPTWTGGGGYAAWLGRYDVEHKGLDTLLLALEMLSPSQRPYVRLRGVDFQGGKGRVLALVEKLRLRESVEVGGPVYGHEKRAFLQQADLYIHPSRWESHSIALIECLSSGVPSLVSAAIHIAQDLRRARAAVVFQPTGHDLATALAGGVGDGLVGLAGARWVKTELDWSKIIESWAGQLKGRGLL